MELNSVLAQVRLVISKMKRIIQYDKSGIEFALKLGNIEKLSSIVSEVNKTVFFLKKVYFKPKIHKTITSN